MRTTLPHNVFYQCIKFQVNHFYSLEICPGQKFKLKIKKLIPFIVWKLWPEKLAISDIKGR